MFWGAESTVQLEFESRVFSQPAMSNLPTRLRTHCGFGMMLYLFLSPLPSVAVNKQWIPNTNWESTSNWNLNRLPCAGDNVILNKGNYFVSSLKKNTALESLVLPTTGELIFQSDLELMFTEERDILTQGCSSGESIQFIASAPKSWYNPTNWQALTTNGVTANSADPLSATDIHTQQLPCQHDNAIFPEGSTFSITSNQPVTVAGFNLEGQMLNQDAVRNICGSTEGRLQFKFTDCTAVHVTNKPCTDPAGCVCGTENFQDTVCSFVKCKEARCDETLTPAGGCCDICGAILQLGISTDFKMQDFIELLRNNTSELHSTMTYKRSLKETSSEVRVSVSRTESGVQAVFADSTDGRKAQNAAARIHEKLSEGGNAYRVTSVRYLRSGKKSKRSSGGKGASDTTGIIIGVVVALLVLLVASAAHILYRRSRRSDPRVRSHSLPMVELHNDSATELGSGSPQNARETEKLTLTITPQDQSPALSPPHSPDSYSNPTYEEAGEQFKGSLNLLYDSADGKVWEEKPGDANRLSSFKPVYDTADGKGSEKEQNGSLDPEGGTDRFTLVCGDKGASPYEVAILN